MSRIKDGNYLVIQSFMVKDLRLKGTELLLYALIYGFSQDEGRFTGSLQYMCEWTNSSKPTVIDNLKSLCEKGLLQKFDTVKNGTRFCEYHALRPEVSGGKETLLPGKETLPPSKETLPPPGKETLPPPGKETLPNNLSLDKDIINNIDDTLAEQPAAPVPMAYGSFRNVFLTETEYKKLQRAWPNRYGRAIDRFSDHIKKTGAHYDSHFLTLTTWLTQDMMQHNSREQRGRYHD